jgi:hypothetical protein
MSNNLKSNKLYGDSVGFLLKKRAQILSITWIPNTAGDAVVLSYFEPSEVQVAKKTVLVTISSSNTITSVPTGGSKFPNTYRAGDAVLLEKIGGQTTPQNEGLHLITTAGNDDRIVTETELTDVTAVPITVTSLTKKMFETMFSAAKDTLQFHYDENTFVPNLAITAIAGSGVVLVQIA